MLKKVFRMTEAGADELRQELAGLIANRSVVAERIKTAREFGDLAENAEYQSARADQEKCEARISELEHILQNVELIAEPNGKSKKVQLGSKVTLKGANGQTKVFQVTGTMEADPLNGKISDESPIGKSLMGLNLGDTVEIKTPIETTSYKLTDIA